TMTVPAAFTGTPAAARLPAPTSASARRPSPRSRSPGHAPQPKPKPRHHALRVSFRNADGYPPLFCAEVAHELVEEASETEAAAGPEGQHRRGAGKVGRRRRRTDASPACRTRSNARSAE